MPKSAGFSLPLTKDRGYKEFTEHISNMVSNISISIEGSTECVADVTGSVTELAEDVKVVSNEMLENKRIADKLYNETEKFV